MIVITLRLAVVALDGDCDNRDNDDYDDNDDDAPSNNNIETGGESSMTPAGNNDELC